MDRKAPVPTLPAGFRPAARHSSYTDLVGPFFDNFAGVEPRKGFFVDHKHLNQRGISHGGLVMTFADILLGSALHHNDLGPAVTVRLTTDFVGPSMLGEWIEGRARIDRETAGLIFISGEIFTDRRQVATTSGVFQRIRRRRSALVEKAAAS